jgi:flagellar motor component MotA
LRRLAMMGKVFGFLLCLAVLAGFYTLEGGRLAVLLSAPSLILVLGLTAGLTLMSCRKGDTPRDILGHVRRHSIHAAVTGVLVGLVMISSFENLETVATGLCTSFCTGLYGLLLLALSTALADERWKLGGGVSDEE